MNENSDYAHLLRWRLLPPEQRPVDPFGATTPEQAADLIIRPDMNEYEAEHAYDLDRIRQSNPPSARAVFFDVLSG